MPNIVQDLLPYAIPKTKPSNNTVVKRYISAKKVNKLPAKIEEPKIEADESPKSLGSDFLQAAEVIVPYASPPRQE